MKSLFHVVLYQSWFTIFVLAIIGTCKGKVEDRKEYKAEISENLLCAFERLEVDKGDDKLYLGAVNRFYQLDLNLRVEKTVAVGPKMWNEECYPHMHCDKKKELINNRIKLIKIDYVRKRVVACGTIKEGLCELRQMNNITNLLNDFENQHDYRVNSDFVASKDGRTVGFIAEENGGKSLYVGSPKLQLDSQIVTDDEKFLTIASRRIPLDSKDRMMFSSESTSNNLGIYVNEGLAKQGFRINFISAFDGVDNGYFVIVYPKLQGAVVKKDVSSYVAQICMKASPDYHSINSYLEIPIVSPSYISGKKIFLHRVIASTTSQVGSLLQTSLNFSSSKNPDVLFASFATEGDRAGGSTVVMIPMWELDKLYVQTINSCTGGHNENDVPWHNRNKQPCTKVGLSVKDTLCSNKNIWDIVQLKKSNTVMEGYLIYESLNTTITSLAVTSIQPHTVMFLGTQDGQLIKLQIDEVPDPQNLPQPYESGTIIDSSDEDYWRSLGSPEILPDMKLNNEKTRLYVMSERRLVSLPLHDCDGYTTCEECLRRHNPFCGWCILENRCTIKSQCDQQKDNFATSSVSNCPRMGKISPAALSKEDLSKEVEIAIQNIPSPNTRGQYKCNFGGKEETQALFRGTSIKCRSPKKSNMPPLNGKNVSIPLFLNYYNTNGIKTRIADTKVLFYNCANFHSCLPCLVDTSKFRCRWCTIGNICRHVDDACIHNPDVVEKEMCPQLSSVQGSQYIHVDDTRIVKLSVSNLPNLPHDRKGFVCKFSIDGKVYQTVNALKTNSDELRCDSIKGFLSSDHQHIAVANIEVLWDGGALIDNPMNLNVTMYRCSGESNCGKCLLFDEVLNCGWCEHTRTCSLQDKCQGEWLNHEEHCKFPKIIKFLPISAPLKGNTRITIEGENFGNKWSEITVKIVNSSQTYADCMVLPKDFVRAERVSCEITNSYEIENGKIHLCVNVNYHTQKCIENYGTVSSDLFKFYSPQISSFQPVNGLYAGGTQIAFRGQYLKTGNNVAVRIDNRDCLVNVSSLSNTGFTCRLACTNTFRSRRHTLGHNHPHKHHHNAHSQNRHKRSIKRSTITVSFDRHELRLNKPFDLESNIAVSSIVPKESITSGGMLLNITGSNLNLAQELILQVSSGIHVSSRACMASSGSSSMRQCLTPPIKFRQKRNYTGKLIVDGCLTLDIGEIKYTKDPFIDDFDGEDKIKKHQSGPIIITGDGLCPNPLKCDIKSARVNIGESMFCNITSIDKDKLVCLPPEDSSGKHKVIVHIGGYSKDIGYLQFEGSFAIVPIVVLIIVVVVVIVGILLFVYRKRADKNSEAVKQLQWQLDMMEAKVAKECKEAFAELQTDMQSDLDNLGGGGIPFRPRHDYIMRVLFPGSEMHERLTQTLHASYDGNNRFNNHNGRSQHRSPGCQALDNFDKLLENKTFLLTFISTLEQQRNFTMKDKGNVAGLLLIVLQNRLPYATSILEELLAELIRNSMESKSHPKLLLRRTESVAEKMLTHWFSILLHGFLTDCAGDPLYMLFRAIKAQLDKGPIDAISGEAKYSLSEDKLLRQTVTYEQVVLQVVEPDNPDRPPILVKVLDCDTISQTKEKIIALKFKSQPHSAHPDPNDFDLEMTSEGVGRAILNDEDNTSVTEGGWKRINTLAHYKVRDRTVVAMVPKRLAFNQSVNSNVSLGSRFGGMRYNGSGQRLINDAAGSLPRLVNQGSRSTTPTLIDDGKKLYHLVKHHDTEQKDGGSEISNKMASEIYLTRLLATKGTIQKFVDDLFETIFSVVQRGHGLPLAIKHMFDFLDDQAGYHGVTDPDVVHTWKSNCLPLRFWVNLIKNPQFLFDINKTALVDSCLTVIGQTFMDSCSKSDHVLGKDSPSNKLLYAKDIPNYKQWVEKYYAEISNMDAIVPQDLNVFLDDESRIYRNSLNTQAALTQLYLYVQKFSNEILKALNDSALARSQRLAQRLEQVATTMTSTV